MTKNIYLIVLYCFITTSLLVSCSSESPIEEDPCKLTASHYNAFYFEQEEMGHTPIEVSLFFSDKVHFEYNEFNHIIKIIGGVHLNFVDGSFWFDNSVENSIYYTDDKIIVENNMYGGLDGPYLNEFEIENNTLISKKVTGYTPFITDKIYTYEYLSNQVKEYYEDLLTQVLHFENGNLTTVEVFIYNFDLELVGKRELLFEDYDNTENLLKGYYYIPGAFYKAFSTNNYKKISINRYILENDEFVFENFVFSRTFNFNPEINQQGSLFDLECD